MLTHMHTLKICKATICLPLALFALLVGINNLIDYDSNFRFVQHTLSMSTVFADNTLTWRAITSPTLWHVGYGLIIFGELLTGALLLTGFVQLVRGIGQQHAFTQAKKWVYLGCTVGFLVWFFGFMVIGAEWFSMWQSEQWNGTQSAFRFTVVLMLVMIFIASPEENT